jgi:hypothetical protein
VEHADHPPFDDQRDPEQGADILLPHQRVDDSDRRIVEIRDDNRLARRRDPARESAAHGELEATLDLLLESLGGSSDEGATVVLDQEHGRGVGAQDVRDAQEQLIQQIV